MAATVARAGLQRTYGLSNPRTASLTLCEVLTSEASKPDFSARDGTPDCAQDPQDDPDHRKDATDGVEDGDPGEIADNEKDDAEDDHGRSNLRVAAVAAADLRIPIVRRA